MSRRLPLMLLATAAAIIACDGDHWVEFEVVTSMPEDTVVNAERIEIDAGRAVGVEAYPVEDNQRTGASLDLIPKHASIIGLDPALEPNQWVIYGISPGSSPIEIHIDGEYVGDMTATVAEPQ